MRNAPQARKIQKVAGRDHLAEPVADKLLVAKIRRVAEAAERLIQVVANHVVRPPLRNAHHPWAVPKRVCEFSSSKPLLRKIFAHNGAILEFIIGQRYNHGIYNPWTKAQTNAPRQN